jgi:N-acetylglutamate synthase-like GNAT family acetyltransferase
VSAPGEAELADIVYRRAEPADCERIAALLRRAFLPFESLYTKQGFEATTPGQELVRQRLAEGPTWVALRGSDIVGTLSALPQDRRLYVRSTAVDPEMRGRGIGGQLLARAEAHARELRLPRMVLSTTPFLLSAIALYARAGFAQTGEGPNDLFGTPLFTMEKTLAYSNR